jgi:uncharacterized protein YktB (UPF0637 family)
LKFNGFETDDFDLFLINGLEDRMKVLIEQLRPKFTIFGDELSNELTAITGELMHPHVAKHARRKTNPPDDSWIAFASNQRGYKMLPHFQICLWQSHLLIQWGIIYEAKDKITFANNLLTHINEVKTRIPSHYQWYKDHMKPTGTRMSDMGEKDLKDFAMRLKNNKNGEIMVGLSVPKEDVLTITPAAFYALVVETWQNLNYLHSLSKA